MSCAPCIDGLGLPGGSDFLYPQKIKVLRSRTVAQASPNIGLTSYSGMAQANISPAMGEDVILTDLKCVIASKGMGRVKGQGLLPGDAPGPGQWHIQMPSSEAEYGQIRDRDILVDDQGYRYQVSQADWGSLGYLLVCIRLEA